MNFFFNIVKKIYSFNENIVTCRYKKKLILRKKRKHVMESSYPFTVNIIKIFLVNCRVHLMQLNER